jgi:glutamine synthetase
VQLRPARDQLRLRAGALRGDTHTIYKNAAKEIASQEGMALTFMAKFNEREGNSCHVHLSLRESDGGLLFGDQPELFDRFVAASSPACAS